MNRIALYEEIARHLKAGHRVWDQVTWGGPRIRTVHAVHPLSLSANEYRPAKEMIDIEWSEMVAYGNGPEHHARGLMDPEAVVIVVRPWSAS